MKKRQNSFTRASALQITLAAALISISAVLLASSFKAAPAASGQSAAIAPEDEKDLASGTWTVTGSLHTGRELHTATLLFNGKVLVAAGYNFGYLTSAELYDLGSGIWATTGSLNTARAEHTATLLPNGKVLVAGGNNGSVALNSAELFDPASGSWTATGSLNTARYRHTATLLFVGTVPKVLVAGGRDSIGDYLASAELYDPATGSWTAAGSLNTARYRHTATSLPSGNVLVAGGYNSVWLSSAELYDRASGSWTATGSLNTARFNHTATQLPSGKVLVAGGQTANSFTSAELYDPASGSWTITGSLTTARANHTATLLHNKVLVAGGVNLGVFLSSAELYHLASGSWTTTGSLNFARALHTATLLPNEKVLVAGLPNLTSAELYTESATATCTLCHRRLTTVTQLCDSLAYQRHLDHGDSFGPCLLDPQENSPAAEEGSGLAP